MKIIRKFLIVVALIFISVSFAEAQVVVVKPQKPKVVVVKPKCPGKNHVWVDGHWTWDKRSKQYVWTKGHWKKGKKGKKWVPGHWKKVRGGWQWIPGHWKGGHKRHRR